MTTARCLRRHISSQTTTVRQRHPRLTSNKCTTSQTSRLVWDARRTSRMQAGHLGRRQDVCDDCTMSEMSPPLVWGEHKVSVTTARHLRCRVSSQTTASHQGCPHITSNGCTLLPSLSPDSSPASSHSLSPASSPSFSPSLSPSLSPDSSPASSLGLSPASSPGPHLASHLASHLPNISDFFCLTYHPPTTSYNLQIAV